jgi:hypothetical protein
MLIIIVAILSLLTVYMLPKMVAYLSVGTKRR